MAKKQGMGGVMEVESTKIELFMDDEVAHETIEIAQESVQIATDLGLEGQLKLATKDTATDQQVRCPFRLMTREEQTVYAELCPTHQDVKEYGDSPIPFRVLEVLKQAKELGFFNHFQVWGENCKPKDPVLIGVKKPPAGEWGDKLYLIARWGKELDEWPALLRKAAERWLVKKRQALKKIREESDAVLATLKDCDAQTTFLEAQGSIPSACIR